jgi:hypothetical protein
VFCPDLGEFLMQTEFSFFLFFFRAGAGCFQLETEKFPNVVVAIFFFYWEFGSEF